MFKNALEDNAVAVKALSTVETLPKLPEGALSETQWKELESVADAIDAAYTGMAEALMPFNSYQEIKVPYFKGNPSTVPLFFLLSQNLVHNTHQRGQISQILDSLKIDHDYSGINASFLS
jgi:hypothetical protein